MLTTSGNITAFEKNGHGFRARYFENGIPWTLEIGFTEIAELYAKKTGRSFESDYNKGDDMDCVSAAFVGSRIHAKYKHGLRDLRIE